MLRFQYLVTFVAYLWGIETDLDFLAVYGRSTFVAYLWGIETFRSIALGFTLLGL